MVLLPQNGYVEIDLPKGIDFGEQVIYFFHIVGQKWRWDGVNQDPFKEYIRESEPDKRDKGYAWHTAIGLQAVDGLKTSEYLVHTAVRNIEGEISFEEANALLYDYYKENPARNAADRTEEADKVSVRIAELLSEKAFSFTPNQYLSIHRKLFNGIYPHAGCIRDYNITKKESSLIKIFPWMRSFVILRYLFQNYGRFMCSKRGIPELRQCSLSNI